MDLKWGERSSENPLELLWKKSQGAGKKASVFALFRTFVFTSKNLLLILFIVKVRPLLKSQKEINNVSQHIFLFKNNWSQPEVMF